MKKRTEARSDRPVVSKKGIFCVPLLFLLIASFSLSGCMFRRFSERKETETAPPVRTQDRTRPSVTTTAPSEKPRSVEQTEATEEIKSSETEEHSQPYSPAPVLVTEEPDDDYDLLEAMAEAGFDVESFVDKQDEFGVPQTVRSRSMQDMRNMKITVNLDSDDARKVNEDLRQTTEDFRKTRDEAIYAMETDQGFFTWRYIQLLRPYVVNEDTFSFSVYIEDFDYPGQWYLTILSYVFDAEGNLLSSDEILEHVGVTEQGVKDYLANDFAQSTVTGLDGHEHHFVLGEEEEFSSHPDSPYVYIQSAYAYALEGDTLYVVLQSPTWGNSTCAYYPIDLKKLR
jgi:hypothetical protein